MEEEQLRLLEEARHAEQERLRQAIEVSFEYNLLYLCVLILYIYLKSKHGTYN